MNGLRRLACLAVVATLAGCATYQVPELPASELATIAIDPQTVRLRFLAVDGVYLSAIKGLNSFSGREPLKLRPGKRAIQLEYYEFVATNQLPAGALLVFEARPGRRYTVHERSDGRNFKAWISSDTGEQVPLLPRPQ